MVVVKRAALATVAVLGCLLYVWIAAVRAVPAVRRRKAAARARWRDRASAEASSRAR